MQLMFKSFVKVIRMATADSGTATGNEDSCF